MPCGACYQTRQQFIQAARRFDIRSAAHAASRGFSIAVDKARGVDVDKKYGTQPVIKATPYRRPPDRST